MKSLILALLGVLALSSGSTAFAAKEVFQRTKPHVNIGTLGYDAGRLTLTAAIGAAAGTPVRTESVVMQDAASGETAVFEAIVADLETEVLRQSVFDFSEEGTVNNLLSGSIHQDGAILVVSAADGPMPQTREHILLARQTGIQAMVVFLDLDHAESMAQVEWAEAQVRSALGEAGYDGKSVAVIQGSATGVLRGDARALLALADLVDALQAAILGW